MWNSSADREIKARTCAEMLYHMTCSCYSLCREVNSSDYLWLTDISITHGANLRLDHSTNRSYFTGTKNVSSMSQPSRNALALESYEECTVSNATDQISWCKSGGIFACAAPNAPVAST